jgi:hypothetical protein
MPCFDASGFKFLPQGTYLTYQSQWTTFERIYYFNSNVSTLKAQGNTDISYYQFPTVVEKTAYLNGEQLHTIRYPTSNWTSPQNL